MPNDNIIIQLQEQIASVQNAIDDTCEAIEDLSSAKDDLSAAKIDLETVLAECQEANEDAPPPDDMAPINTVIANCADAMQSILTTIKTARKWIK